MKPRAQSISFAPVKKDEEGNVIEVEPEDDRIRLWQTDLKTSYVSVPFQWGMNFIRSEGAAYSMNLSGGAFEWVSPRLPDPNHPCAAPGQGKFFDDILTAVIKHHAILIEAPTGSGKTVSMLRTCAMLGAPALIIVPSKALADQWMLEAKDHLGLTHDEIGLIQGPIANWKGRKITIAVIHNLFQKEWSEEFLTYFGTVCIDEAHRLGAPEFSKVMPLFPALHRIAATATPDRKDGCMKVVTAHMGEVIVKMEGDALEAKAGVIEYADPFAYKIAKLPLPIIMKILVKCVARNELIIDTLMRLYRKERYTLILSDRVEHLQTLQKMAINAGVPEDKTALYVGSYKVKGKSKTVGQAYLREIRENPAYQVIFATYAMMKEGTNIPRLDSGIDATPRADSVQAIGRIRRPFPNKKTPIWFTLVDVNIPLLAQFAKARIRDYKSSNVTIL